MSKPSNNLKNKIDTYLSGIDHERFMTVCKLKRKTRSEIAREAILWYLEFQDQGKENKIESELSRNIKNMTDRICGMLARQGAQTGTLYELAWQNHAENQIQERFIAAANLVKGKMRKRLEDDEKAIAERMTKVVGK